MAETDHAWAAGIIDGEGTLIETGAGSLRICVAMTHKPTLLRLRKIYGGRVIAHVNPPKGHRQIWKWTVLGKAVRIVLLCIEPFLVTKRREARWLKKIAVHMALRGAGARPLKGVEKKRRERWSRLLRAEKKREWLRTM